MDKVYIVLDNGNFGYDKGKYHACYGTLEEAQDSLYCFKEQDRDRFEILEEDI